MSEVDVPELLVLKFADSAIPVFKETRGKDYIAYGEDNKYPDYLTYLFNKSAKHNAIITGKAFYIFGKGFENGEMEVNRLGESLNDVIRKATLDLELYGGYRLEVIWNRMGVIGEVYHVDFSTLRTGKNGGYYYKEKWDKYNSDAEHIPAFNPDIRIGSQIYAYNEYRPSEKYYPLPGYIGCNNYIETDIEISKYYLSSIRNGMTPSKMFQFFTDEPSEDKKREIESRFAKKFSGAENAGKFILVFNKGGKDKSIEVEDLSGTDLDKMFIELNKTAQQEIFSGHLITSPMLFGIKTEGQLGGATELKTSYEIFQNTYAAPKANAIDKETTYLLSYSQWPATYKLQKTDPIGVQFDVKDVLSKIPVSYIFEKLGIPKELAPATTVEGTPENLANEHIRNLTAKQHQEVMRVIREYSKGKLTANAAKTLLRTGLGLTEEDINNLLGIESLAMSADPSEDEVVAMFDECGESRNDYEILKSKKVCFDIHEAEDDESIFIEEAFKDYDVSITEAKILELIKKDSRIEADVIAKAIGETEGFVKKKIAALVKRGILENNIETVGVDEILRRVIAQPGITKPPIKSGDRTVVSIKYSYDPKPGLQPVIATSRPFCRKLIQLNRLYTRAEIEKISLRLGYDVFARKGGWWGKNPECRHRWVSNIVTRKAATT